MISVRLVMPLAAVLVSVAVAPAAAEEINLLSAGKNAYTIVVPRNATGVEQQAALELQNIVRQAGQTVLPVMHEESTLPARAILVGRTEATARLVRRSVLDSLDPDGFLLQTAGQRLVLCGGARKGTLYGVYAFAERFLGCRRYSAAVTVFPRVKTIVLPVIRVLENPVFQHRETHYLNAWDRGYSDWHKLQSLADSREEWGMWVHTFDRLVPAAELFGQHPEYFSLLGGRRIPNGQLCLSNPEVFTVLTRRLREMMDHQPSARYWSVSQNDNINECQCSGCRALNAKFGGPSGTMLDFVNRVAALFPDKVISTLAYSYTRGAPTNVRPLPNVNIMFCSIECNRSEPIPTDPRSASFRKDFEGWKEMTNNIIVWDYVVQFRNLVSPFPNLRVLQPNIRYFAQNGVRMMFQQGCGGNVGEFGELRTYLIAKLLWNPDVDIDSVMNDFLNGYYGAAGPAIRKYIDTMHDALAASGKILDIYGYPYDAIDGYLRPDLIATYSRLFDEAEQAVRDSAVLVDRVRNARLPLEFAILDISLHDATPELSYFDKVGTVWKVRPAMQARLERFVAQAKKAGVERLEESGTSPDDYRKSVQQLLRVSIDGNLAFGKPVTLLTRCSEKYPAGGGAALTNGLHGPSDYHCNWLGFEGEHCGAVIDLGRPVPVRAVKTAFLQSSNSWVWLPLDVEVSLSADGKTYSTVATIPDTVADTTPGAFTREFNASFAPAEARYVKIFARSRLVCPDWHIGAGKPSWLFIDEVVVE